MSRRFWNLVGRLALRFWRCRFHSKEATYVAALMAAVLYSAGKYTYIQAVGEAAWLLEQVDEVLACRIPE